MSMPKEFEWYLRNGIAKKCSPDKQMAKYLVDESDTSFKGLVERLEKIGVNENNANSIIKDCYDILMELVRARMLIDGYASSGQFAHEAEVSYMAKMELPEIDISFMNELRFFRNRIIYYGKILDKEYAIKVAGFLRKMRSVIKRNI